MSKICSWLIIAKPKPNQSKAKGLVSPVDMIFEGNANADDAAANTDHSEDMNVNTFQRFQALSMENGSNTSTLPCQDLVKV